MIDSLCLASVMLRYKKNNIGKIHALRAMQHNEPLSSDVEHIAAPYLKGKALYDYLLEAKGIEGMLKDKVPIQTIQGVLARCMKEKNKEENPEAAKGIWGFVEFAKSSVVMDRQGVPDFIIEMGYESHFPSKWAQPTARNKYYEMKPILPYLPSLPCFEPIQETSPVEHTCLASDPLPASSAETPFDNYYNRLSNLAFSIKNKRFQEALAFGCDILQYYPDGGEKAMDVFLHLAQSGGALYSHRLAMECLEKAKSLADPENRYHCAKIASTVQTIFRFWGCFEEEKQVFYQHRLQDPFSKYYATSLATHLETQFDLLINTLASRLCLCVYHRCCGEECQSWRGQSQTLDIILEIKKHALRDEHLALLYVCEAADLTLQLQTTQHMQIEMLTGAALFTAKLAKSNNKKEKNFLIKSLVYLIKFHTEVNTKRNYLAKMASVARTMAKQTRSRTSLLAGNVYFTQAVLLSILGPSDRIAKTYFQFALKNYASCTDDRSYRVHLNEICLKVNFRNIQHGPNEENIPIDSSSAISHIVQNMAAHEIICGEPQMGQTQRTSVETILREDVHLLGSLAFGLESIKKRI